MGTETLTTQNEAPSTGADEFTADERAYFDSRGEKGLAVETEAPAKTEIAKAPDAKATEVNDDPDGTISIDEKGLQRDAKTGRFVPHGAFHKEREARKAAETTASAQAIELARTKERLALLAEAMNAEPAAKATETKAADDDPMPDFKTDVLGFLEWQNRKIARLEKNITEGTTQTRAQIDDMQTGNAYRSDAVAFAREQKDFAGAYNHLVNVMGQELELLGVADPKDRMATIAKLEREQVAIARRLGRRPAEHIYKLALTRGWKAPADSKTEGGEAEGEQKKATDAAAEELARLEKGRNAAMSLSGAGGSAPTQLTADAIASMNEHEFKALLDKTGGSRKAAMRKLLGG